MEYTYNGNGDRYLITDYGKMKSGNGWVQCVIYKNTKGEMFVREIVDFNEKFTKV